MDEPELVERSPGVTALDLAGVAWAGGMVVVLAVLARDWSGFAVLLWAVLCLPALLVCLPWVLWFSRADLRLGPDGIRFGRAGQDVRASVSAAARLPHFAPWAAVGDVRLVSGTDAARQMSAVARPRRGIRQPSIFYGFFPSRHRGQLRVDVDRLRLPGPATSRGRDVQLSACDTWVLPVRDAAAVREALTRLGVQVLEQSDPVVPGSVRYR